MVIVKASKTRALFSYEFPFCYAWKKMLSVKREVGGSGRYPDKFLALVHMQSFLSTKKS